jgi:hypothetical protein
MTKLTMAHKLRTTSRLDLWMAEYAHQLEMDVWRHPEDYVFGSADASELALKMRQAFLDGTFTPSEAVRNTAAALHLPPDREAIRKFLLGD